MAELKEPDIPEEWTGLIVSRPLAELPVKNAKQIRDTVEVRPGCLSLWAWGVFSPRSPAQGARATCMLHTRYWLAWLSARLGGGVVRGGVAHGSAAALALGGWFGGFQLHLGGRGIEVLWGFDRFTNLETLWLNNNKVRQWLQVWHACVRSVWWCYPSFRPAARSPPLVTRSRSWSTWMPVSACSACSRKGTRSEPWTAPPLSCSSF